MEFLDHVPDLSKGSTHYSLLHTANHVAFQVNHFSGEAFSFPSEAFENHYRGYFLRKGFISVLSALDPKVVEPIYVDKNNQKVIPPSDLCAVNAIHRGDLYIQSFRYRDGVKLPQKHKAFCDIVSNFVATSSKLDFVAQKEANIFSVKDATIPFFHEIAYHCGGSPKIIHADEIVQKIQDMYNSSVHLMEKSRRFR